MLEAPLKLSNDSATADDVYKLLKDKQCMLWVTDEMALVLRAEGKALFAWLVAGENMDNWLEEVMNAATRYAREFGYTHFKATVRPGMGRRLKRHGWTTAAEIMRREIWTA